MTHCNSLFITKKSVEEIQDAISKISSIKPISGNNVQEEKALCRKHCEMTIRLLDDCFEYMYGVDKCKRKINRYKDADDINQRREGKRISEEILIEICTLLPNIILLKDFPTCKPILEWSKDLATECVKDMSNNKFLKLGLGTVSLLSKGNDVVTIDSVWNFYDTIINELEREMNVESWSLSPAEKALYYKAKAERGYCFKAMLKTGFGIVHELKGLINEATVDEDIRLFENRKCEYLAVCQAGINV